MIARATSVDDDPTIPPPAGVTAREVTRNWPEEWGVRFHLNCDPCDVRPARLYPRGYHDEPVRLSGSDGATLNTVVRLVCIGGYVFAYFRTLDLYAERNDARCVLSDDDRLAAEAFALGLPDPRKGRRTSAA